MPLSIEEKKKLRESKELDITEWKDTSGQMSEAESMLRSFAIGGDYISKTVADTFEALDITGKSQSYEEATGNDLDEELRLLKEQSPLGETSGVAEATRYLVPAATAALPLTKVYDATAGLSFGARVLAESFIGGTENLVTDLITGDIRPEGEKSIAEIDFAKAKESFLAGSFFTAPVSAITQSPKGLNKVYEDVRDTAQDPKMAGGGSSKDREVFEAENTPIDEESKYFDKEFIDDMFDRQDARDNVADMRKEGLETIKVTQLRAGTDTLLDKEIKVIKDKFNKLEESPEDIIIAENQDLFQGVDIIDAYDMLKKNPKLRDSLKADIEKELFDRTEKIDFIKRGDDRLEIGAKSDLYEIRDVDSTKAEQLAMDIQVKRAAKKKLADDSQKATIASRKLDYEKVVEELMPEVNKLHKIYNNNPTPETLFDLEEALRKVEPSKPNEIFKHHETGKTIGDIGDGFTEVGETMSKKDIAATESAVGMSTKGKPYNKIEAKKFEEQRAINKKKHQEFLDENKDKIDAINSRGYENEADRIEYEKLVEQDKKYREMDRAFKDKIESAEDIKVEHADIFEFKDPTTGKSFDGKKVNENTERVVYEITDPHTNKKKNIVVNKKSNEVESAINPDTKGLADKTYEFLGKKTEHKELVVKDTNPDIDTVPNKPKEIQEIEKLEKKVENLRERAKKLFNETKTNWKTSYRTDGDYATYQRIHRQTRDALNVAAKAGADTKEYISDLFKANSKEIGGEFDKSFAKHVLYTDYSAIREFKTKSDAMAYLRDNKAIYAKAKSYIDQTAKGINDKGQMNHVDFTNNGYQIAQRAGLDPKKYGDTIDKLVSIKAMDDQSWSFIEKNGGSNLFESMVNMADVLRKESDEVFKDNPHAKVKGYMAETYDSIYRYEMKDGEFKRFIDAEVGMVQGGLPQKLDSSRTGEVSQFPKMIKDLSDKAKLDYAEANNLGVVLNKYGQPVATRKVASEAQRISIGKTVKASDIIPLTFENNVRKLVQRDGVINDIVNTKDNTLFSSKTSEGMVALSNEELQTIPRELRGKVAYVNKDFKHMLLGNKQIQKAEKQWSKITEQLLKDTVSHFKENVVLKNPASWVNNMGYNFFVNMQEGISPAKTIMYMKKGLREKMRAEELVTRLTRLELDGKSGTKEYVSIEKELVNNLYYTMDRQGLAVTVMSNIMDSPIASKRLSDKMMKQGLKAVLKDDKLVEQVTNVVSNLYLSPQSKAGQAAMNMFGSIDAMGRYSMAAEQMAKGASLDDAIKKANGIYGDLDMIAPMWSQAIQQYGFIPFSNWYFRMSGGLTKSVMDNKVKAIGVAALLYGISEYTDKRTDSMNPLTSLVETPADMLIMSPYFNLSNYARNVTTPAVYKKGYRAIESGDPLSVALTRDF